MPVLCEQRLKSGCRHFIYGGTPGVAEEAAFAMSQRFPGIVVAVITRPVPQAFRAGDGRDRLLSNATRAGAILVCLGCPKQERWILEMQDPLDAKALLAVGQAVDILAGRSRRAPEILSRGASGCFG